METFPLAVPTANIGLVFAHKIQVITSLKPISTTCFLDVLESHKMSCDD